MCTTNEVQTPPSAFDSKAYRRLVIASGLGSGIEHYDFFSYVIIAPLVFDKLFFPRLDSIAATIAVYATFAVGFISRPIGGILFGHFGDRYGRKVVLMITLLMMGICSFFIGCTPASACCPPTPPSESGRPSFWCSSDSCKVLRLAASTRQQLC